MALSTYGPTNCEVVVPLSIEYSSSPVTSSSATGTQYYRYSRHAKKTYRYKGMTESAVQQCLAEKRAQYTRRFCSWRRNWTVMLKESSTRDYYESVATFNVVRNGAAPVFDLQITVDEVVNIYTYTVYDLLTADGRTSLEAQFQRHDLAWVWKYKYDEPGETSEDDTDGAA